MTRFLKHSLLSSFNCARCGITKPTAILATALCTLFVGVANLRAAYEVPNPAYNPPAAYYNNATGTGTTLRTNLHNIISAGFQSVSYGDARYALAATDQDPNNASNVLLVYNRASVSSTWDVGVTWNREHLWPQSKLGVSVSNTYKGPASDLFELKPCNPSINSGRSNDAYGTPTSSGGYFNGTSFFPGDADKGDVARSMFYMATRYYNGSGTPSIQNLSLVNGYTIATYQMGDLQSLLHWNYTDGVDNFERHRNQTIYINPNSPPAPNSYSQLNRNPFIDHPEYVWAIYGDSLNDSQISIGTPDASGASSVTVNLGRIMLNGSFGTSTVAVNKSGADPTTFDVTTSGDAVTVTIGSGLPTGPGQPMNYGAQAKSIVAGLNAPTNSSGQKTGTITIRDTDLTTAGAGKGAADGNDTIIVVGTVVGNRIVSASSVDLGAVHFGAAASGATSLSTTGANNQFTQVTVAGQVFSSASSTGMATIGPSLGTAGSISSAVTLTTMGEGLAGEMPIDVSVAYAAQVFTGKMAWKPAVGSGNWATDANWTDTQSSATAGAPGLAGNLSFGDAATFDNATAVTTISLFNASPHLASVTFAGPYGYTVGEGDGSGILHIDNGEGTASVIASSGGHQITAPTAFDSRTVVSVTNPSDTLSLSGPLANSKAITKAGGGTLDIRGATQLAAGSSLIVSAGMLRLSVGGGSTIGAGVTASVAGGATMDSAGPISALNPAGLAVADRPLISNDGQLTVPAEGAQVVGAIENGIEGTGTTSVAAGASLTADHIIQAGLNIDGSENSLGLMTIADSDENGDPVVAQPTSGLVVAGLLDAAASNSSASTDALLSLAGASDLGGSIDSSLGRSPQLGSSAVPEPGSGLLLAIGIGAMMLIPVRLRCDRRIELN